MAKYLSLNQNKWVNFQLEDSAYDFGANQTKGIFQSIGGIYRAALPTYTDGDAAMCHFTTDGKLFVQNSSDIELGAVEIKDGDSDTRMDVITQDAAFGTATNGLALFGKYQATPTTYTDNDAAPILLDANGRIVLSSDIEIGGVELKDGATDNRAEIKAPNTTAVGMGLHIAPARYMATPPTLTDTFSTPLLTDSTGNLKINSTADVPTTLTGGSKTVAISGTAEALGASLATKSIYIRAKGANTGNVYVGDSSVDAVTSQQIILAANDSVTIDISNRATVYVDVAVGTEGVDYLCSS